MMARTSGVAVKVGLGLHHRTVSLWVKASAVSSPDAPQPKEVKTAEMDELFPFIGQKKQDLHHHDRRSTNTLLFGLESGRRTHATGYSGYG